MSSSSHDDKQDIEDLLPWYITGRLSPVERGRVEAYLERHPEMQRVVALARAEAAANVADNEALRGPDPAVLDRLLHSLPEQRPARGAPAPSFLERLSAWIASLSPSQLGLAAAALGTIFLLEAVTIGTLIGTRTGVYETATGPTEPPPAGAVELLIGFKPEASMADTTAFLKDNGLTLIDGPRAGLFRVRAASGSAGAQAVAERLKASPVVAVILPGR